jgi:hypothetical protein
MYADDLVVFAPSAKGLQKLVSCCFDYGCENDIIYNAIKSNLMIFNTKDIDANVEISLGDTMLEKTTVYKYLGHIICNDLNDELDIKDKERLLYIRSNMLLRKFYFCTDAVKERLFKTYCCNVYLCSLWVNCRKSVFKHFTVSYNNAYRILHGLSFRCSASFMFATAGIDSCEGYFRRCFYSIKNRAESSVNNILVDAVKCDVYIRSMLVKKWIKALHCLN